MMIKRTFGMCLSIQQVITEHVLCARHCSRMTNVSRHGGQPVQTGGKPTETSVLRAVISTPFPAHRCHLSNLAQLLMGVASNPRK